MYNSAWDSNIPGVDGQACSCIRISRCRLGRVRWITPTGLTGLTPLASVGPVQLGPLASGLERTSVTAPEVVVSVNALQSALQRKLVLSLQAVGTQVGARTPCGSMPATICSRGSLIVLLSCQLRRHAA